VPFTPSHPAAALPVRRLWPWLPLDALVIGTLSPDFQYLLLLAPRGKFGHTLPGMLFFCLPVSLACWLLFRALVRPALLPMVPPGLAGGDDAAGRITMRTLRGAAVAALLGAWTHVLWDGFTHEGGWAVRLFPVLLKFAFTTDYFPVNWFTLLQHASTLAGGAVVIAWVRGWLRAHPADARRFAPGQRRRLAGFLALLLAGALAAGAGNALRAPDRGMRVRVGYGVVGALAGLVATAVAYGAWDRPRRRERG
jgi:membrane-bound metal-dependent hydrolase YbcI (DUF457 family)